MRAVDQAEVSAGDKVVVMGCGPIGLAAVATMADRGIDDVVAVDPSAVRRDLACQVGARAALDPATDDVWDRLASLHGTVPFMFGPAPATNAFIEASGVASVITDVIERSRPEARLSVVALHYAPIPTSYLLVLMKQLTIRGSMEYPPRFADAIDLLARRDLSVLITHRFPLARFDDALAVLGGSKDCGKVMVTMD
jgi:threonine dehydrogenase-like Zn-dependent dehydrogenase